MIAFLEEETRRRGYAYSADFLKIAGTSLHREAALADEMALSGKTNLENAITLQ